MQTITTHISTYQHNGTKLVLTIYTCISYLFQQLRYYLCKYKILIRKLLKRIYT